jgi:hypothetical protein
MADFPALTTDCNDFRRPVKRHRFSAESAANWPVLFADSRLSIDSQAGLRIGGAISPRRLSTSRSYHA